MDVQPQTKELQYLVSVRFRYSKQSEDPAKHGPRDMLLGSATQVSG